MIENGQASTCDHDSILGEHRPTMAPSNQNQSLIIVLSVSFPDFFAMECPSE